MIRKEPRIIDIYLTDDMAGILKKLGMYEDAESGKLSCYFCGKPVSLQNIGGLFKQCPASPHPNDPRHFF